MSLIADDPMRSIRWRWDRAETLSRGTGKIKATELDDDEVVEAAKYIRRYRTVSDRISGDESKDRDAEMLALRKDYPLLMAVASIYASAEFMKWAIEALICSNAPAEAIAVPFGVDPEVIRLYETYFFDVRSRLGNEMWVSHALLSPAIRDDMATTDWDFFWKELALWYGSDVLQAFWHCGDLPEGVEEKLINFNKGLQLRNVAKAHLVRGVSPHHAHDIIDEAQAVKGEEADEARDALMSGAGQMLGAIAFRVANQTAIPSAIERPLEALGKTVVTTELPELPEGGIMAGREPDSHKAEDLRVKPEDQEETPTEAENPSTAVESKPKPEPEPSTIVTREEEADATNSRIREKKEALLEKMRNKRQK